MTWPRPAPARPLWLVTLADLALLLVGFFVLLHATGDRRVPAQSLRAGFAGDELPVAAQGIDGFAPGSAAVPQLPTALAAWAAEQLRDPRVRLTVTGSVDGTPADVDPATRSPALLAADRARAVAALLAPLSPARVALAPVPGPGPGPGHRGVTVTLAFAGERNNP